MGISVGRPGLVQWSSLSNFLGAAQQWDDLWKRSEFTLPTLQAEFVAQWVEQFAPDAPFRALAVEQDGRLVAGAALVGSRWGGWLEVGGLTGNHWSPCGQVLLDPRVDGPAVMKTLLNGFDQTPWPMIRLDGVLYDSSSWRALLAAAEDAGWSIDGRAQFEVVWIATIPSWSEYQAKLSRNIRRNLNKTERRLGEQGELRLRLESSSQPDEIRCLLQQGFEVEDRSWKGQAGTSVLRTPGMLDYYIRQASLLGRRGQLQLAFLDVEDRPIAFEYGWLAKNVCHSFKVGYDDEFAAYSPGQLLVYRLLQSFFENPEVRGYDGLGPVNQALGRWRGKRYRVGRMLLAPKKLLGRTAMLGYKQLRLWRDRWRNVRLAAGGQGGQAKTEASKA